MNISFIESYLRAKSDKVVAETRNDCYFYHIDFPSEKGLSFEIEMKRDLRGLKLKSRRETPSQKFVQWFKFEKLLSGMNFTIRSMFGNRNFSLYSMLIRILVNLDKFESWGFRPFFSSDEHLEFDHTAFALAEIERMDKIKPSERSLLVLRLPESSTPLISFSRGVDVVLGTVQNPKKGWEFCLRIPAENWTEEWVQNSIRILNTIGWIFHSSKTETYESWRSKTDVFGAPPEVAFGGVSPTNPPSIITPDSENGPVESPNPFNKAELAFRAKMTSIRLCRFCGPNLQRIVVHFIRNPKLDAAGVSSASITREEYETLDRHTLQLFADEGIRFEPMVGYPPYFYFARVAL